MKLFESVSRFIGCIIICYFLSAFATLFVNFVFRQDNDFLNGLLIGGITFGLTVFYYQKRKIKNFVQSC